MKKLELEQIKKWVKILFICFIALLINKKSKRESNQIAASILRKADIKVLKIGTAADFPPFAFLDENQKIIGFEIDVIKGICEELNFEYEIQNIPSFDVLIPNLQSGKLDVLAAGISYTPARKKALGFLTPHHKGDPLVIISNKKDILNLEELRDKNIVVNEGYTADLILTDLEYKNILRLGTVDEGILALKCHRADAFVTAYSTIGPYLKLKGNRDFHFSILSDFEEEYSFVVHKNNHFLKERLQGGLDKLRESGKLEQLITKWF